MKRGKQIDAWYPFYIYKWLFGSTRHELIINRDWPTRWPALVPLVPEWMLKADFIDLRAIFTDLMTLAKTDGGYIRANESTPYPHSQLAGMWCVPLDCLNATIAICLHKDVHKLEEPTPGIYYLPSQEVYAFSDRYKRKIQAELPECSENKEQGSGKAVPILKDNIVKDRTEHKEVVDPFPDIIKTWNEFAHRKDLPWIRSIEKGSSRERHLLARLKDPSWNLDTILKAIAAQPFLTGDNDRGWLVNFDWILNPTNVTKILDGVYVKDRRGDAARRAPESPYVGSREHFKAAKGKHE